MIYPVDSVIQPLNNWGQVGTIVTIGDVMRNIAIDRAITRSIRQGRGLRFSGRDRTFEVNKLYIIKLWLLLGFCRRVFGPWALRENNALVLANHSARYIGYKPKS